MSRTVTALLSATVVLAVGAYVWNLTRATASLRNKHYLEETATKLGESWDRDYELPAGAFAMLVQDDGMVTRGINAAHLRGTNFLKDSDENTTRLFQKMKARGTTGGGYVYFQWVDPGTNRLTKYIGFAKRLDKDTLCIAQPIASVVSK